MLNKIALALSLSLAATACAVDPSTTPLAARDVADFTPASHELVVELQAQMSARLPADLGKVSQAEINAACPVIADEGPCSVACDPLALRTFIPAGTCVAFACLGEDGADLRVGGCNFGETSAPAPQPRETFAVTEDGLTTQQR